MADPNARSVINPTEETKAVRMSERQKLPMGSRPAKGPPPDPESPPTPTSLLRETTPNTSHQNDAPPSPLEYATPSPTRRRMDQIYPEPEIFPTPDTEGVPLELQLRNMTVDVYRFMRMVANSGAPSYVADNILIMTDAINATDRNLNESMVRAVTSTVDTETAVIQAQSEIAGLRTEVKSLTETVQEMVKELKGLRAETATSTKTTTEAPVTRTRARTERNESRKTADTDETMQVDEEPDKTPTPNRNIQGEPSSSNQTDKRTDRQPGTGWSTVSRTGSTPNPKGIQQMTPAPAKPTSKPGPKAKSPYKPRVEDDTQGWIIRFQGNPPPNDQRMSDMQMFNAVNCIDKETWAFDVVSAKWTKNGLGPSIMVRFTADTTEKAIETHQLSILNKLGHGIHSATLTRNLTWSRIAVMSIPCMEEPDEDGVYELMDVTKITRQLESNPLYKRLHITQPPRWMGEVEGKTFADVQFSFEDPFGDLARDFMSKATWLNGKSCPTRKLPDRLDVKQCARCWRFGANHPACKPICKLCGGDHAVSEHQRHCATCTRDGWAADGQSCVHFACPNCRTANKPPANHTADDPQCPTKGKHVKTLRDRSNAMAEYQRTKLRHTMGLSKNTRVPF
jgi:hypothetical protein